MKQLNSPPVPTLSMKTVAELTPEEFILPPLHQAARQRDLKALRKFIAEGQAINSKCDRDSKSGEGGNSALWFAAQGLAPGSVPIAAALLEAGADINQAGEFNMTPMHMACSWGHADLVEFLHSHGAKLNLMDDYGRTPVQLAQEDYAEGQATKPNDRPDGFEGWLNGMAKINAYFATLAAK